MIITITFVLLLLSLDVTKVAVVVGEAAVAVIFKIVVVDDDVVAVGALETYHVTQIGIKKKKTVSLSCFICFILVGFTAHKHNTCHTAPYKYELEEE